MSHFYTKTGEPRHEQPTKKGAKNATRPTTIADAREQGLLPSVSGITKVWANPGLDYYKITQAARCAYKKPPIGGEEEEEYVQMIYADSQKDAASAAEVGTLIHKTLEALLVHRYYAPAAVSIGGKDVHIYELLDPALEAMDKLDIAILASEKVLVNAAYGYAGTTDVIWSRPLNHGILDYKTKRTKPGKAVEPNQDHALQIAAYHMAAYGSIAPEDVGYNVYISTTEPGRVEIKEWSAKELAEAWEAFQHCLALWRYQTGYDPRTT